MPSLYFVCWLLIELSLSKGTGNIGYPDSFSSFMLDTASCLSSCHFLTKCTVFKVLHATNALGKGQYFRSVKCHAKKGNLGS